MGRAGEPQPASADAQAALRMLERSRETRFGMPRPVSLDADAGARIDALLAQMAERSLRISTLLARKLDEQEKAQLDTLQLELSQLRVELDRERTVAVHGIAAREASSDCITPLARRGPARRSAFLCARIRPRLCLGPRHQRIARGGPQRHSRSHRKRSHRPCRLRCTAVADPVRAGIDGPVYRPASRGPDSAGFQRARHRRRGSHRQRAFRRPEFADRSGAPAGGDPRTHDDHLDVCDRGAAQSPHARPFQLVALASGSGTLRSAPVADPMPKLQAATAEIRAIAALFGARSQCQGQTIRGRRRRREHLAHCGAAVRTSCISRPMRSRICVSRWPRCWCCRPRTPRVRRPTSPPDRCRSGAAMRASYS